MTHTSYDFDRPLVWGSKTGRFRLLTKEPRIAGLSTHTHTYNAYAYMHQDTNQRRSIGSSGALGDDGEAPGRGQSERITHPRLYKIAHIIQNLQTGHCKDSKRWSHDSVVLVAWPR